MTQLDEYLRDRLEAGGFSTEDTLTAFLPLVRETLSAHAAAAVAPLEGMAALHVDEGRIWFAEAARQPPRANPVQIARWTAARSSAFDIVSEVQRTTDLGAGEQSSNLAIADLRSELQRPAYLPNYVTWEHRIEHHDPLTDVLSLGLILATLACGLDLHEPDQLRQFVEHRDNLFFLQPTLHPVLAQAIVRMTELDRHRRAQDLYAVLKTLENYRDQDVSFDLELVRLGGAGAGVSVNRQQLVLRKLRERLFEISRRNRLLHFRATMSTVNLTQASIPLAFDVRQLRPEQILTWTDELQQRIASGSPLPLNKYLNFSEALYLPSVLDRMAADARRDEAEFGFAQLRLALCFLHWANLKVDPVELYDSPLLLLPVRLQKKKGIRDTYYLEVNDSQAEVNPVVRHLFQQLYGIALPESIDLSEGPVRALYEQLAQHIASSAPGVSLELIDRPRIAIIHAKARRNLDQYRRRARVAGRGVRTFGDVDYSYDPANYHPLGLKLFQIKVRPPSSRLRELVEERPRPRMFATTPPPDTVEKERVFYELDSKAENPYRWQFDLCNLTLANFHYRKMSLVRDYDSLLSSVPESSPFEATFSLAPKAISGGAAVRPLPERFDVVACDPTQAAAIAEAQSGHNFIIQGPPGTGKSQTITNLIADYVAQGKRVLFVCEKRAAIDVVYARLRHCGLDDLCCLIHDSQTDKRSFVMDLKQTYENFLAAANSDQETAGREAILAQLTASLEPLEQYAAVMSSQPDVAGLELRTLVRRGVLLSRELPALDPLAEERLPYYRDWTLAGEPLARFAEQVLEIQPDGILAHHPLHALTPRLADVERPLERVTQACAAAQQWLTSAAESLNAAEIPAEAWGSLSAAQQLASYAAQVQGLAAARQMKVLDPRSAAARELQKAAKRMHAKREALEAASERAAGWRRPLPLPESSVALEQARRFSHSRTAWLRPSWWRLRRVLAQSYDFSRHRVRPDWVQILTWLEDQQQAAAAIDIEAAALRYRYEIQGDVEQFLAAVRGLQPQIAGWPLPLRQVHERLMDHPDPARLLEPILAAQQPLEELSRQLELLMDDFSDWTLDELNQHLAAIRAALAQLPDLLACIRELRTVPRPLSTALQRLPLRPSQIEAAIVRKTFEEVQRRDRNWARFDGVARARHVKRLGESVHQWHDANAAEIARRVRERFNAHVARASLPAGQLTEEEKVWKKCYTRGRRELEHEFGKSMRYKSIRDLVSGDSGAVIRDLKPVWLMSPLSVSDTLPLDAAAFDVVVFDEASQITLEEAVPPLFRARQAIVVGDEMQLPPTDFFSAKRLDDEDRLLVPDADELIRYDLDSDSFLNQATRNLPSVMLGWHYRSRSESLISFSNWAFYGGRLLTVPEQRLSSGTRAPLVIQAVDDGTAHVQAALERPISFHHLPFGVYDKRRNRNEADYIAHFVAGLLQRPERPTIGIVAFSEAQQGEIEAALQQRAQVDAEFRVRLSEELEREDDGQFSGLLVKNLENIQGDERDVIILSVCYGYNPQRRMLMNFGPINRNGGEKRLNVAFSRARQHMAIVSSIRAGDITNEYNDGANCLKNYLRYAEAVSAGDSVTARTILHGFSLGGRTTLPERVSSAEPLVAQLAEQLRERGWHVECAVGQSHFRCDLAVRDPQEAEFRLGILVDSQAPDARQDALERELLRPQLLESFGWRIAFVLAKDWYEDSPAVLARVLKLLGGQPGSA